MPDTPITSALQQLQRFDQGLHELAAQELGAMAFSTQARSLHDLLQALPERYPPVLLHLLDRLEAGALFTEESCSFSQSELLTHLRGWADKARQQLTP